MLADFQPFPDTTKQKCKHCSLVFQAILNTPLKQWGGSQWGCQARKKQKLIMKTRVKLKIKRKGNCQAFSGPSSIGTKDNGTIHKMNIQILATEN